MTTPGIQAAPSSQPTAKRTMKSDEMQPHHENCIHQRIFLLNLSIKKGIINADNFRKKRKFTTEFDYASTLYYL